MLSAIFVAAGFKPAFLCHRDKNPSVRRTAQVDSLGDLIICTKIGSKHGATTRAAAKTPHKVICEAARRILIAPTLASLGWRWYKNSRQQSAFSCQLIQRGK